MDEDFVLGVIASEGSFHAKMSKTQSNAGYTISPVLEIHMNSRERGLLDEISNILPVDPSIHERSDSVTLYVGSRSDVSDVIEWAERQNVSPFDNSVKAENMRKLKKIIQMLNDGKHRSVEGVMEIAEVRNSMNDAGSDSRVELSEVREHAEAHIEG